MRPVFVGNFEFETRQSELERLFSKYGRIERVGMKSGFIFVYLEDERDAEDAIRGLDDIPFGYDQQRLSVEWAKGECSRHHDGSRLQRKRMLAKSLGLHKGASYWTELSVEYAVRDDDERDDRYDSPRRGGAGRRGLSPYGRSPSPAYRRRPNPRPGVLFMIAITVLLMTGTRVPIMGGIGVLSMADIAADHMLEAPIYEWRTDGEKLVKLLGPQEFCRSLPS